MDAKPDKKRWSPTRIAGIYALVGVLWIVASDIILVRSFKTPITDVLTGLEISKGALYVLVTAGLVYWLVRRNLTIIERSEGRYRDLFNSMSSGVAVYEARNGGKDFIFRDFNRAAERIEKIKKEDVIGKSVLEVFPGVRDFGLFEVFERVWRTGEAEHFPLALYKDNRIAGWRENYVYKLPSGEIVAVYDDVTARRQAEDALQRSEEQYRELVENVNDVLYATDEEGVIAYVSPVVRRLLGYEPEGLIGRHFLEFVHPDDCEPIRESFRDALEGRLYPSEFRVLSAGKEYRWVRTSSRPVLREGQTTGIRGVLTDVTERKQAEAEAQRLQAQLLQAQKLEAIGTLAGGVAHDFNNLLTAIRGYCDLILQDLDKANPAYKDLQSIHRASTRAADLIRQLLLFSRRQPMEFVALDPNKTVEDLLKMLQRLIGEDITIQTELTPEARTVRGDPGNIEQVIVNLFVNARDAMPNGGKIILKTENVVLKSEDCATMADARPGRFVRLSVSDTGTGMTHAVLQHIFEPFFTTKGAGKGTGLGLAVVYGIVKEHEGWVTVRSELGRGSTFQVYLPAVSGEPVREIRKETPMEGLQGRGERILLTEDEEGVRAFATRVLGGSGYAVFAAANAREALDLFARERGKFDVLFSDVVLPDGSGLQLCEDLLFRNPALRVLLSSGYLDDKSQLPIIRQRGFHFIQKPYAVHALLEAVKSTLAKR